MTATVLRPGPAPGLRPFYSENKSAEHFGLGLNHSHILCGLHGGCIDLSNASRAEPGRARILRSGRAKIQ